MVSNSDAHVPTQQSVKKYVDDNAGVKGDGLAKITVGSVEPTSPSAGDLWIDTSELEE
jgi:hypothetical protein